MQSLFRSMAAIALLLASLSAQAAPLQAAEARAATQELAGLLEREYLFPDVGERYARAIRASAAAGAYDGIADPAALAAAWERELRAIQADAHLRILTVEPGAEAGDTMRRIRQSADPIGEARWLAEGVAYLPIQLLPGDPESVARMASFLDAYAGAHTLVLDLRACVGGTLPVMDELFSRLYRESTRLLRMDTRDRGTETQRIFHATASLRPVEAPAGLVREDHWVTPAAPGGPWAKARVFVLTDVTASACEHLAYALKQSGRATLVGDNTSGAGHFGGFRRFASQFEVFVPVGRTYDPATGIGWEATGVAPHRAVPAEDALKIALVEAGVDTAAVPEVAMPRPPVRVAAGAPGQKRYGLALAPPHGGETALPVIDVVGGTVAANAGVRRGDLILRMNGKHVAELGSAAITNSLRASPLELVVERDGAQLTIRMSLEDAPAPGGQ